MSRTMSGGSMRNFDAVRDANAYFGRAVTPRICGIASKRTFQTSGNRRGQHGVRIRKVRGLRPPEFPLCKTEWRRRQGHLRNKAHPEPLPSRRWKAGLPDFGLHPASRHRLTGILSMTRLCAFVEQITLPGPIASRLACPGLGAGKPPHSVSPAQEGWSYPRSPQVVRA
jgi:hypothetical protein